MARGEFGRVSLNTHLAGEKLAREILIAYPQSAFPMARSSTDLRYEWYRPEFRGIMPLDGFHASRSLQGYLRQNQFALSVQVNTDFAASMKRCAAREETWINPTISHAFSILHDAGLAHALSIDLNGINIGGIYGLALGRAFFGESMYSNATNGSKLALWALVKLLSDLGFELLDTQYLTPHLASLGAIEIDDMAYQNKLDHALLDFRFLDDIGIINLNNLRAFGDFPIIRTGDHPDIITRMIERR